MSQQPSLFPQVAPVPATPAAPAQFTLRPYQREAVDAIEAALRDARSTLVVMPTGTGKTVTFASAINRLSKRRVLVLAHREELLRQNAATISAVTGRACEIDKAGEYASRDGNNIVVASVQTQIARWCEEQRMHRHDPEDFDLVIIDEAHHAPADSYRRVVDHFQSNPHVRLIGVTATPDRLDEAALGQVFESVAFDYELSDAVRDGWLVVPHQRIVTVTDLDLSAVRTTAGDLNQGDLEAVLEAEKVLYGIAVPTLEMAGDKKTLVFAASVRHAEMLAELFNRYKPESARMVCGATPAPERQQLFADYRTGRFQFLCNVGVATEGFDEPGIECIAMARPTKSRALYAQAVGRGTRAMPSNLPDQGATADDRLALIAGSAKPRLEVIDFTGNAGRHKLICLTDILGGKYRDEIVEAAQRRVEAQAARGEAVDVLAALEIADRLAEEQRRRAAERKMRKGVRPSVAYITEIVDPFNWLAIRPQRERAWHVGRALSERQTAMLTKYNIDPETLNYTQGQQVIKEIIKRDICTVKQAKVLKRAGYDPEKITFTRARQLIDYLAANGWRRPAVDPPEFPAAGPPSTPAGRGASGKGYEPPAASPSVFSTSETQNLEDLPW